MSVDQVKAFLAKAEEDAALGQKLKDAQAAYTGSKEDGIKEVVLPIAAAAGFTFTVDDFKAAATKPEGEASDDELEAVAGGYDCTGLGCWLTCAFVTW